MSGPPVGVLEDPATGVASGPLGCYLVRHNMVTAAAARSILSLQGVKMGRPSQVHISIAVEGGDIRSVRVGGEAVLAGGGTPPISLKKQSWLRFQKTAPRFFLFPRFRELF